VSANKDQSQGQGGGCRANQIQMRTSSGVGTLGCPLQPQAGGPLGGGAEALLRGTSCSGSAVAGEGRRGPSQGLSPDPMRPQFRHSITVPKPAPAP
jgi:hypothetical protein